MKAYTIVGYAADASIWCVGCAEKRYDDGKECPCNQGCISPDVEDSEGNPVHPIFAGDESSDTETCMACGELLIQ